MGLILLPYKKFLAMEKYPSQRTHGNVWLGFLLLIIGAGLVLHQMNLALPYWLFSWKTLLITIGLFVGFRSGFQGPTWIILILIGGIFLLQDLVPWMHWHQYGWPIALIIVGLFLILRPRRDWRHRNCSNWKNYNAQSDVKYSSEDYVDHTAVFGSVEKTILSKDFHGGDLTSFFGGTQLNLTQADIHGKVVLRSEERR